MNETSIPDFEREGSRPFVYTRAKSKGRVGRASLSYWRLPERLYDDPEELAAWANRAHAIAQSKKLAPRAGNPRREAGGTKTAALRQKIIRSQRRAGVVFAVAFERDACFLEIEFALDAAARFVGDLAVLQQPINVLALGGDQLASQFRRRRDGVEPVSPITRGNCPARSS